MSSLLKRFKVGSAREGRPEKLGYGCGGHVLYPFFPTLESKW